MKKPIDLHKIGEKLEFNRLREQTFGQRSEGIVTLSAGKKGPPAHVHTKQLEGFEVISGQMIAVVNGKQIIANAGDTVLVQAGEAHTFRNGSHSEPMVAKFWYEPALNIEWMLQTMGEDAMQNGGDWAKVPLLPTAYLMYQMRKEYRMAGMPFWLQDALLGLMAGIAKFTGAAKKYLLPETLSHNQETFHS
ncbi:MAG: cupin domain-containing protein [Spirosomataceae bacterium]